MSSSSFTRNLLSSTELCQSNREGISAGSRCRACPRRIFCCSIIRAVTHSLLRAEPADIFTRLFCQYSPSTTASAGLPDARSVLKSTSVPLDERWRLFKPFFGAIKDTGYVRFALRAARDLFGLSNPILFADLAATVSGAAAPFDVNDLYETANLAGRSDIVLAGFDLYGELGLAFPDEGEDFSYACSLGLQQSLGELDYWTVAAEFFANGAGTSDTSSYPALVIAGDFTPFYVGEYYAYAAVTRKNIGRDGISATLAGFANFSDLSFLARLSTSVRVPRLVPFTFALSWAGGGDGQGVHVLRGEQLAQRRAARELRVLMRGAGQPRPRF